jgi:hypothetical protein
MQIGLNKQYFHIKQEVPERTNRLLSFDATQTAQEKKIRGGGGEDSVKFEMGSGAVIYIPTFINIGSGIQIYKEGCTQTHRALLRYCLGNLTGCNVSITDGRNL